MFTLPLALGSLGVENCLRNRSLLRALVLRACHVAVRCWEPWCEKLFAVLKMFEEVLVVPMMMKLFARDVRSLFVTNAGNYL